MNPRFRQVVGWKVRVLGNLEAMAHQTTSQGPVFDPILPPPNQSGTRCSSVPGKFPTSEMNCTKSNSPSLPCLPPGFSEKFVNNFAFYDFLSRPWGSLREGGSLARMVWEGGFPFSIIHTWPPGGIGPPGTASNFVKTIFLPFLHLSLALGSLFKEVPFSISRLKRRGLPHTLVT